MTNLKKVAQNIKKFYNKKWENVVKNKKDDKNWLKATNLPTKCLIKKLDNKHYALIEILEKIDKSVYRLKLSAIWKIYNIFNEILLTSHYIPFFLL